MSKSKSTKPTPKAKPEPKPKAKPEKQERLNRPGAAAITIRDSKSGVTIEQLIAEADKDYTRQGGNANAKESAWSVRQAIAVMKALKMITVAGGAVEVIGKVVAK